MLSSSNDKTVSNEVEIIRASKSSASTQSVTNIDDDLFKLPNDEPKFIEQTDNEVIDEANPIPVDIKNVFETVLNNYFRLNI